MKHDLKKARIGNLFFASLNNYMDSRLTSTKPFCFRKEKDEEHHYKQLFDYVSGVPFKYIGIWGAHLSQKIR